MLKNRLQAIATKIFGARLKSVEVNGFGSAILVVKCDHRHGAIPLSNIVLFADMLGVAHSSVTIWDITEPNVLEITLDLDEVTPVEIPTQSKRA